MLNFGAASETMSNLGHTESKEYSLTTTLESDPVSLKSLINRDKGLLRLLVSILPLPLGCHD